MTRLIFILFLVVPFFVFSQSVKHDLDTSVISKWQVVHDGEISNNGRWAFYRIVNSNLPPDRAASVLVLTTLSGKKIEERFEGGRKAQFTDDSRFLIIFRDIEEVVVLNLETIQSEKLSRVSGFTVLTVDNNNYIIFQQADELGRVIVKNLTSRGEKTYNDVENYSIKGHLILMTKQNEKQIYQLWAIDLENHTDKVIWSGSNALKDIAISSDGNKIAFVNNNRIWLCDIIKGTPAFEIDIKSDFCSEHLLPDRIKGFFFNDRMLELSRKVPDSIIRNENGVQIFSYRDSHFVLDAEHERKNPQTIYLDLLTGSLLHINPFENISADNKFALIKTSDSGREYYWNKKQRAQGYVINTLTGDKIGPEFEFNSGRFSSNGKYFLFTSLVRGDFYSLDLSTSQIINLTDKLPVPFVYNVDEPFGTGIGGGIQDTKGLMFAGFSNTPSNPEQIILYDKYDIWRLDPSGSNKPTCLTGGYGRNNHIVLRLVDETSVFLEIGRKIYLSAFNQDTKEEGYFLINWQEFNKPRKLAMGPYSYANSYGSHSLAIKKAKDAEIWVVQRQSATESVNFYSTKDFQSFYPVSDLHPEKDYKWYTTELINFTTKDGAKSQAILYKPQNIDTSKKYPVLFNFYEQRTQELNQFHVPSYLNSERGGFEFNFPLMLAQGYLICVPDIHFKIGETAQNILDCVDGAANAISDRSYVDSGRFGASGGSFGGYATNCLAAFSHRFKALVPISGMSNMISTYGNIPGLRDELIENRQGRMGVSLSTGPEVYLHNSPVVYAKDVTTPLLIVNTLEDHNVNPQQGIEWFISLRREGKPVWMLRYQSNSHGIGGQDARDLYARMNQFFDHYLKRAPTPKWMMESLGIQERSAEEGFRLMPSGIEPGVGLNTEDDIQKSKEYQDKNKKAQ